MDIDYKRIGRHLREARKNNELTQRDVSKLIHVAENTYSNMERGQQKISLGRLIQLCTLYGITPGSVINDCTDVLANTPDPDDDPQSVDRSMLHFFADHASDDTVRLIRLTAQTFYDNLDRAQ